MALSKLQFVTSTPLNIAQGSGTFTGIRTLARALERIGVVVEIISPKWHFPVYTLERLAFNELLRRRLGKSDAVVGFDLDGYRIAGRSGVPHIASIKGVIADEMRFERGLTRATMAAQAALEANHVRRAGLVIAPSHYSARRLQELYQLPILPSVVPECIDLAGWQELFRRNPAKPDPKRFTVLSVCRFYPRKRLPVLLRAAARLRESIPALEVRIVGGGPEARTLRELARTLKLEPVVQWLGDLSQDVLATEYNRADVFCLPSVQEGFGIVFLEAMAAGKPIVAVRAAAMPEVVPHGVLAEPDDEASLADCIHRLWREPDLRQALADEGRVAVKSYEAGTVARAFLSRIENLVAEVRQ